MKIGKIPENVLKRSVLKQLHTKRQEVVLGAGVGEDCAAVKLGADEVFVLSTDPITGTVEDIGKLAIQITLNDLASAGAAPIGVLLTILLPEDTTEAGLKEIMAQVEEACQAADVQVMGGHTEVTAAPIGVLLTILLPEDTTEAGLKEIMAQVEEACQAADVQVMGGHTEVTAAVNQAIITVCGVGKVKDGKVISTAGARAGMDILVTKWIGIEGTSIIAKEQEERLRERFSVPFKDGKVISTAGARAGMDILVTKWIGIEGTSIIAKEQEERLRERFSVPFIESAKGLDCFLSVLPEAEIAVRCGVCAMHDVTEGGIFGALWEMAEASGVGLEIDVTPGGRDCRPVRCLCDARCDGGRHFRRTLGNGRGFRRWS